MPDVTYVKRWTLEAIDKYDAELAAKGIEPKRSDVSLPISDEAAAYAHLRWMCGEIRKFAEEERFDKCNRWIGFMQGALWMLRHSTIDRFRADNTGS